MSTSTYIFSFTDLSTCQGITDQVITDSKDGKKLVDAVVREEIREAEEHKNKHYQDKVDGLMKNHKFTAQSALKLVMEGEKVPMRMTEDEKKMTLYFHNELRQNEARSKNISDMPYVVSKICWFIYLQGISLVLLPF